MTTGAIIFKAINEIANTPSTKTKEALVKAAGTSLFQRVLYYAYDPFKIYGIACAPSKKREGQMDLTNESVWMLLDMLTSKALTGGAAREEVQNMIDALDDPSAVVFQRIINGDMRAGFGDTIINKVFKNLLPEFPYMRCTLPEKSNMDSWDWSVGIYVQQKADGMFANVNQGGDSYVWITSRAGSRFPAGSLGIEAEVLERLKEGTQTHGELTVYEDGKLLARKVGNGILNSILKGGVLGPNMKVRFEAWDQIPLGHVQPKGFYSVPYKERLASLIQQCEPGESVRLIPTELVFTKTDGQIIYRKFLKEGKEGVIYKHPELPWSDTGSGGSKDQVKGKLEFQVELRVIGLVPGKPGKKTADTFGSLLCQSSCGLLEVGVSGLSDADRARGKDWIDAIVTVTANDIMVPEGGVNPLHSLFLPRFEEERLDKREADSLQRIKEIHHAAINGD